MNTQQWLLAMCLAASVPAHASPAFQPIEVKDSELSTLRGRFVMPGRIISFGVVMSTTWQNANGDIIGAHANLQVQATTIKPQFYVQMVNEKGTGTANLAQNPGQGVITGGAGLNATQGVTQSVRAAGDNNSAYNNVDLSVTQASQAPAVSAPQGQVLAPGSSITGSNGAGSMTVASNGNGVQLSIQANNNQGSTLQSLGQGGLSQLTALTGSTNQVSNLTQLNVVLGNKLPGSGSIDAGLSQLKGLRNMGY